MRAPASRQARATAARRVSIETTTPRPASASTTGRTRRSSSSAGTAGQPGRVDSPPTSTMSAPSETKRRPSSMACAGSRRSPPSEKESGVTLTIAITRGRSRGAIERERRRSLRAHNARLRLGIGIRRGAGAGRHRRAAAAVRRRGLRRRCRRARSCSPRRTWPISSLAQRLVLEQRLGDRVQLVDALGQDLARRLPRPPRSGGGPPGR